MLIFILILSCENNIKENKFYDLTNNRDKFWYIDLKQKDSTNKWLTLWYFTSDNEYFRYLYNPITKNIKILDNGDKIEDNTFSFIGKDSISLNRSHFPILKLSKNEFILKNIYSHSFFPEDSIILKSCMINNEKIKENCDAILQKMDSINKDINAQN